MVFVMLILALVLTPLTLAEGLNTNYNSTIIYQNKTVGITKTFNFTIFNQEPLTFYNITFEDNDIIEMNTIYSLNSGASINVLGRIITNEDVIGNVKIKGFYEAYLGPGNETYNINVDYNDGLSICDRSVINGDSVTWNNLVLDEIRMKNMITNEYITNIPQGGNYTIYFDHPQTLRYQFFRQGLDFTEICDINVLGDTGLINDPSLDTKLFLEIKNFYESTNLSVTVLDRNYTMNFYDTREDVIIIKNIGNKPAQNVNLSGSWFKFNKNLFNLDPDESSVVTYRVEPIVSRSNDTGKTHIKNITIEGNFPTKIENFNIKLNYAEIGADFNLTNRSSGIQGILNEWCDENPDICYPDPIVVYKEIGNGTGNYFNVTFEQDQVREMLRGNLDLKDNIQLVLAWAKERELNNSQFDRNITTDIRELKTFMLDEKQKREEAEGESILIWVIVLILIIIALLVVIVIFGIRHRKAKETMVA